MALNLANRFADDLPKALDGPVAEYLGNLKDALAANNTDLINYLNQMINDKHATLMIPRVTIDAAQAKINVSGADAGNTLANMYLEKFVTTTSNTIQTAVSYIGRGVLSMVMLGEFVSTGTAAFNAQLKITIDDNVVYDDAASIARESSLRVVVGGVAIIAAGQISVSESAIGLPFNSSCLIQYKSDGTRTITAGWKIAKKL